METVRKVSQWKWKVKPVLDSKVSDFQLMGYKKATEEDIWKCLEQKVWKGAPEKRLYEVVEDIFHLSSSMYMSYLTVQAYQDDGLLASIAALNSSQD